MNTSRRLVFALCCALACAATTHAQTPGDLDQNFSADGKTMITWPEGSASGYATVLSGSNIYFAGIRTRSSTDHRFVIGRLLEDGTLDDAFGSGGTVTGYFAPGHMYSEARGMARQSDGKIVIVGNSAASSSAASRFGIARFNTDGTYDDTFSGDGVHTFPFTSGVECRAWDVAIQNDGKIVVAGWTRAGDNDGYENFAIARLNANGTLDNAFSNDGLVELSIGVLGSWAHALVIQNDGRIVVAGTAKRRFGLFSSTQEMAVVRLTPTGLLDNQFNGTGKYIDSTPAADSNESWDVSVDAGGRIVVAGERIPDSGVNQGILLRLTPAGALDFTDTYNTRIGLFQSPMNTGFRAIAHQCDGKILVSGVGQNWCAVGRINANGSLDNTFGYAGFTRTYFNTTSGSDIARGIAIRPSDQYITTVGGVSMDDGRVAVGVMRYQAEASIIPPAPTLAFNQDSCKLKGSRAGVYEWQRSTSIFYLPFPGNGSSTYISSPGSYRARYTSPTGCVSPWSEPFQLLSACTRPADCLGVAGGAALPGTPCNDNDLNTGNDTWDIDCQCAGQPIDCAGVAGGTSMPGTPCDDGNAATLNDAWASNCTCIGYDCAGVAGGTGLPGTPCDDNDPSTDHDTWTDDCQCVGQALDCAGAAGGTALPGTPCNDNDPLTGNDTYGTDCVCTGQLIDCLGVPGGAALPGTPCDDGNTGTTNDTWIIGCNCLGMVGIEENTGLAYGLSVHPNPVQDALTITYTLVQSGRLTIALHDMQGRIITTFMGAAVMPAGEQRHVLTLPADLAHGSYMLVITGPQGRSTMQVSK